MHQNRVANDLYTKGGNLLFEGRRRGSGFRQVLVTVPGARDTTVNNATLSERSILVLADVGNRRNPGVIAEHCDPLAGKRDDRRAFFRYAIHVADFHKAFLRGPMLGAVQSPFLARRCQVKEDDGDHSHNKRSRKDRACIRLQRAQHNVGDEQGVGEVNEHVQALPNWGRQVPQPEIMTGGGHKEENDEREKPERLKWKISDAAVPRITHKQTDERVDVSERVKLNERERSVNESQQERGDSQVAAIVE